MKARKDVFRRSLLNLVLPLLFVAALCVNLDAQKSSNVTAIKNARIFDGEKIIDPDHRQCPLEINEG